MSPLLSTPAFSHRGMPGQSITRGAMLAEAQNERPLHHPRTQRAYAVYGQD